jgi:predicted RNA-binding Zn-ribbon protein involved in translation (DUF1610 family)
MFTSAIKSRPQYTGLAPAPHARRHIVAAQGEGAEAVLALFGIAPADFAGKAHLLYAATGGSADRQTGALDGLGADRCDCFTSDDDLLVALGGALAAATMGTRLYAAGTEGFVGRVIQLGVDRGIDHRSVITEHKGSLARRVQCVHCKGFTENVTASIFECRHCGNLLFVRDHYSRRLAAFQGVCVNAEDRASRPQAEEVYP